MAKVQRRVEEKNQMALPLKKTTPTIPRRGKVVSRIGAVDCMTLKECARAMDAALEARKREFLDFLDRGDYPSGVRDAKHLLSCFDEYFKVKVFVLTNPDEKSACGSD